MSIRPLEIFDHLHKTLPAVPCLDVTGARPLIKEFRDKPTWPKTLRLPYSQVLIGYRGMMECPVEGNHPLDVAYLATEKMDGRRIDLTCFSYAHGHLKQDDRTIVMEYPSEIEIASASRTLTQEEKELAGELFYGVFYSLILLEAIKNVTVSDYSPVISRQERRHRERVGLPTKYKILAIELPGQKKIQMLPVLENGNHALPLHWVRGHFAKYDIHPMFGKYVGTFWRPAHVKGDSEHGVIEKDYLLKGHADVGE